MAEEKNPQPRRARARRTDGQFDQGYKAQDISREVGEKTGDGAGKYDQKPLITKPKFNVRTEYH